MGVININDNLQPQQANPTEVSQGAQPEKQFGNQFVGVGQYIKANDFSTDQRRKAIEGLKTSASGADTAWKAEKEAQAQALANRNRTGMAETLKKGAGGDSASATDFTNWSKAVANPITPLDQKASVASAMAGYKSAQNFRQDTPSWLGQATGTDFNQALGETAQQLAWTKDAVLADQQARAAAQANLERQRAELGRFYTGARSSFEEMARQRAAEDFRKWQYEMSQLGTLERQRREATDKYRSLDDFYQRALSQDYSNDKAQIRESQSFLNNIRQLLGRTD